MSTVGSCYAWDAFSWSLLMQSGKEMGIEFTDAGSIFCLSSNPLGEKIIPLRFYRC